MIPARLYYSIPEFLENTEGICLKQPTALDTVLVTKWTNLPGSIFDDGKSSVAVLVSTYFNCLKSSSFKATDNCTSIHLCTFCGFDVCLFQLLNSTSIQLNKKYNTQI